MSLRPPTEGTPATATFESRIASVESARVVHASTHGVAAANTAAANTVGLQAAVDDAITDGATILLPPGTFAVDDTITIGFDTSNRNPPVKIAGSGGAGSLFHALFTVPVAPTTLVRENAADTYPIIQHFGYGLNLENLAFDGQYGVGALLQVDLGFELRLNNVRFYRSGAQAAILLGLSNARLENVHVDNCGSASAPALRIASQTAPTFSSNTVYVKNLHIERSTGIDLDIATGATAGDYAEFILFDGLHIEGIIDNSTLPDYKTEPLVKVGNARSVMMVNSFLYAAKGGCILFDAETASTGNRYSIHLVNCELLGQSDAAGKPARLVDLKTSTAGDSFSMTNCKLDWCSSEYVRIQSTFAGTVDLNGNMYEVTRFGTTTTRVLDSRATRLAVGSDGDFSPYGHYVATRDPGPKPTIAAGANAGTSPPTPTVPTGGLDARGKLTFGTGTGPAAGQMAIVTFTRPYASTPVVVAQAKNSATAALGVVYVGVSTTAFSINVPNAPTASQAATVYEYDYWVIG